MRENLKYSILRIMVKLGIFRPYLWFIDKILDWYCEDG